MSKANSRPLTERQKQVVRLIARGRTAEEIAGELGITRRTAKAHADVIRVKLGCRTARQIPAAYFEQTGENPYPTSAKQAVS